MERSSVQAALLLLVFVLLLGLAWWGVLVGVSMVAESVGGMLDGLMRWAREEF